MRKFIIAFVIIVLPVTSLFIGLKIGQENTPKTTSKKSEEIKKYPFNKYQIENLANKEIKTGSFEIIETLDETDDYIQYKFAFKFDPTLDGGNLKTTTGLINLPKKEGKLPVILMIRGYVDQNIYTTGMGSINAGEYFAKNGFITIAPDFLGYAESDEEAEDIFETRFQTYTTVLSLLHSIKAGDLAEITDNKIDPDKMTIWAHSNGGQIALTVLAITKQNIPTTLWAPVTKSFPYSILYYLDEADDHGKFLRKELAKFEEDYDVEKYTFTNYLEEITAPIQLHQGTSDDAVPVEWSDEFVNSIKDLKKDIVYYKYPGADHNLNPGWNTAVERDLSFFTKEIDKDTELLSN